MSTVLHLHHAYEAQARLAPIDQAVAHWIATKAQASGSAQTRRVYAATLARFRDHLREIGRDLDAPEAIITAQVQPWAAQGEPSPATYNQRCAIVSSFYRHCQKHRLLADDCAVDLRRVDRRKVQAYGTVEALTPEEARAALRAIDRSTLAGLRDYALLRLALSTGRRLAEVAGLRWGDLRIRGQRVRVTFQRCKGNKVMVNTLPVGAGEGLLAWLQGYYGTNLVQLPADTPIWVSLSHNGTGGQALSVVALQRIAEQRMGCHFHALRHTFARILEDGGAKVSDIQAELGHESLATTGRYLAALKRGESPYGNLLDAVFDP
jgi:integrase